MLTGGDVDPNCRRANLVQPTVYMVAHNLGELDVTCGNVLVDEDNFFNVSDAEDIQLEYWDLADKLCPGMAPFPYDAGYSRLDGISVGQYPIYAAEKQPWSATLQWDLTLNTWVLERDDYPTYIVAEPPETGLPCI